MAAIHDLQANSKTEAQFLQIDYLLLVLSICGFGFVSVCLTIVFLHRKMRSRRSGSADQCEVGSSKIVISDPESFIPIPPIVHQHIDMNNSTIENSKFLDSQDMDCSLENETIFKDTNSENNDFNSKSLWRIVVSYSLII